MFLCIVSLALVFGAVSAASAGTETSIYDWWTGLDEYSNQNGPWDVTSTSDLWGYMTHEQSWTIDVGWEGQFVLEVEYAGYASANAMGWYQPVGAGTPTTNEIFSGGDGAGTVETVVLPVGTSAFGFYLAGPGGTFYSEDWRNGNDGVGTSPDNWWDPGTGDGYRHVRTFVDDPVEPGVWVLCWEDVRIPDWQGNPGNYYTAWDNTTGPATLDWGGGPEPDYQDMIVTFRLVEQFDPPTPELSSFLLLAMSLAAVPVLRRRRRA